MLRRDEVLKVEPALAAFGPTIHGGTPAPSDDSGDAMVFTHGAGSGQALAELISGKRPALSFGFCGEAMPAPKSFVPVKRPSPVRS